MLEVFFSESAKSLRQMSRKIKNLEAIISLDCHLDIGDISNGINGSRRAEIFKHLFNRTDLATQQQKLEKINIAAKTGRAIRIWKSATPSVACGFAFLCDELRAIDCEISVVLLPEYVIGPTDTITSYSHWGEVSPDEFERFLSFEKKLTSIEKGLYANRWQELKVENSPLRAIVNGKLLSVPVDFYDHLIIKNISDDEFVMEELIAHLMGKYPIGVSDAWYAHRIAYLLNVQAK